jgi:hypothetical protein
MIQYKLIKVYPESPKLGTIDWFKTDGFGSTSNDTWRGTEFYDAHSQFWQKVEELDYEILNVKYSYNIRFLDKGYYRVFKDGVGFELQYLLENGGTIHSVKRLSDGEVFTIGDSVRFEPNKNSCFWEINNFFISKYNELLVRSNDNLMVELISTIKHKDKTPLFTTEDGVDIFKGDRFFVVDKQFYKYKIHETIGGHFSKDKPNYIRFNSKEEAEKWVLFNKPCLSINDLIYSKNAPKGYATNTIMESFKELVKSKL